MRRPQHLRLAGQAGGATPCQRCATGMHGQGMPSCDRSMMPLPAIQAAAAGGNAVDALPPQLSPWLHALVLLANFSLQALVM